MIKKQTFKNDEDAFKCITEDLPIYVGNKAVAIVEKSDFLEEDWDCDKILETRCTKIFNVYLDGEFAFVVLNDIEHSQILIVKIGIVEYYVDWEASVKEVLYRDDIYD